MGWYSETLTVMASCSSSFTQEVAACNRAAPHKAAEVTSEAGAVFLFAFRI